MVNGRSGTILGILRPQGTMKKKSVGAWNDFQLKSQTIAPIPHTELQHTEKYAIR